MPACIDWQEVYYLLVLAGYNKLITPDLYDCRVIRSM